jgi:hypothetical protein
MNMHEEPWRKAVVRRSAVLCAGPSLIARTTVTRSDAPGPEQLVHGGQLRIWGVEARRDEHSVRLAGQVNGSALPRGPLREHVHVEVLNDAGVVVATQNAALYPFTALRKMGTARPPATISAEAAGSDGMLQLRVVDGVPHD